MCSSPYSEYRPDIRELQEEIAYFESRIAELALTGPTTLRLELLTAFEALISHRRRHLADCRVVGSRLPEQA